VFGIGAEHARVRVTVREEAETAVPLGATPAPLEKLDEIAEDILTDILELMGIPADVSVRAVDVESSSPTVALDVEGEDLGMLIGRRGETLSGLQYVLTLLVQRRVGRWARITIDVAHYRDRQEAAIRSKAIRMAERVQRTQTPIAMEPMRPNERRLVHLALSDHPGVTTHSIGAGDERRVVVSPRA
jgi:spoIIIJ-associated protein